MDEGYFPPGSMLRHVQEHRAVGHTFGLRALILGATHPVPYVGTASASGYRDRPFQRLSRTAAAFETIFFGTRAEADKLLARVHAMHTKVHGVLPENEGAFPAGTPYDAFDPELMLWTMGVLADSSRVCFETLVRPLSVDEREQLWQEWVQFGELFGMPRSVAPATAGDFDAWLAAHVNGPSFHVTDEARIVGRAIANGSPVPAPLKPGVKVTHFLAIGMLPHRVRRAFGLRWSPAHTLAHGRLATAVRASQHVVPDRLRIGPNDDLFRMVSAAERRIIAAGRKTIDLPAA